MINNEKTQPDASVTELLVACIDASLELNVGERLRFDREPPEDLVREIIEEVQRITGELSEEAALLADLIQSSIEAPESMPSLPLPEKYVMDRIFADVGLVVDDGLPSSSPSDWVENRVEPQPANADRPTGNESSDPQQSEPVIPSQEGISFGPDEVQNSGRRSKSGEPALPIFDSLVAAFGRNPQHEFHRAAPEGSANIPREQEGEGLPADESPHRDEPRPHSVGRPSAPTDAEWRILEERASTRPRVAGYTACGLPRRRPGLNLIPDTSSLPHTQVVVHSPGPRAGLTPEAVRRRLGTLQRGLAQARQQLLHTRGPLATEEVDDSQPIHPVAGNIAIYRIAHEVLTNLYSLGEQVSNGTRPRELAAAMLHDLKRLTCALSGSILTRSPGQHLITLAGERNSETDSLAVQSWLHAKRIAMRTQDAEYVVFPIALGDQVLAVAALTAGVQLGEELIEECWSVIDRFGPRLGFAMLFEDVRRNAMVDERLRVADLVRDALDPFDSLLNDLDQDSPEGHARKLFELGNRLQRQLRDLPSDICAPTTDLKEMAAVGISRTLADHVTMVCRDAGLGVHLDTRDSGARHPVSVSVEILRIVQEAIRNVIRHAQAKNLWLMVRVTDDLVKVVVEDDGIGIGDYVDRRVGAGIAGMQARAESLGGTVWVRPRSGGGTSVTVEIVSSNIKPGKAELAQSTAGGDDLLRTILTSVSTSTDPLWSSSTETDSTSSRRA